MTACIETFKNRNNLGFWNYWNIHLNWSCNDKSSDILCETKIPNSFYFYYILNAISPKSSLFVLVSKLLQKLEYLVFFFLVNTHVNQNESLLGLIMSTIWT